MEEAIGAISGMLEKDEFIDERTMLTRELHRLTSLCLRSTYFHFKDSF